MNVQFEKEIVMRPINTVRPYVRNPRRNDKTVELLTRIIPKVGFNVPLVIDEKGIIVKGHARFTAAIRLGMTEVPCIITHADEEAIKADRITDNKISEFSEWVDEELLEEIESIDMDLSDIGFSKADVDLGDVPDAKHDVAAESGGVQISEEAKAKVFAEFEAEQKAEALPPEIQKFVETPHYKCVCDKCGCVMFFTEADFE